MTDLSDDEALAAEYVLGTLDHGERVAAADRRRRDLQFAGLVAEWEARLTPLSEAVPELAPPPALFGELLSRLQDDAPAFPADNVLILRRRVRVWRRVAAVTSALAAALALWIAGREAFPPAPAPQTYVAVLQRGADTPSFVVSVDMASHRMSVVPLATSAPPDKSYELWMIAADQPTPQSMGVVDAQGSLQRPVPRISLHAMAAATYAVTLEPRGGSPTGKPTSTPMFVGKLIPTSL